MRRPHGEAGHQTTSPRSAWTRWSDFRRDSTRFATFPPLKHSGTISHGAQGVWRSHSRLCLASAGSRHSAATRGRHAVGAIPRFPWATEHATAGGHNLLDAEESMNEWKRINHHRGARPGTHADKHASAAYRYSTANNHLEPRPDQCRD